MLVTLISGLAIGAIYSLVAVGYNLTWLTSKAVNFAYAAFIVTGMFLTAWMYSLGIPFPVIFLILIAIGAIVAFIEYITAILPLQNRGDHAELVTTVGVTTVLQGLIFFFSPDDVVRVPFFGPEGLIDLPGGGRIAPAELVIIVIAVVVALGAHFWSTKTRSGLAALAQSEDRDAALILGVRPGRIAAVMFVLSGSLGFVLAPFIGPITFAIVAIAITLSIKGFVVLAIGGIGSQLGALIAGLSLGVVESLVITVASASYQNLVVYLIFIATLLLRPQGIFGARKERTV
ncbi:branched-chain amino acid ABC transporter permease [Microbacterium aurantiacum]|uniref:Branched-chain amino acid ABC transporter permease n=1 Tax=Microbacterium aurantiacum TaxID=162393 RepID=A0ABT8FWW0_9MICO|nr:branched-chain amino acid ABC transporter permease [Microbacterium aurantiacum]MDN4465367.1 branched-chain amino acid ABC transporter permease [Microbacterium aurantiacum]